MSAHITFYWLSNSRAQRILWLLEELEVPYTLEKFYRDPVTFLAPPEFKALHPLGASPLLKITEADGSSFLLAESGAIVQYLTEIYAGGKLGVTKEQGLKEYSEYISWLHWAEGSAFEPFMIKIFLAFMPHVCASNKEILATSSETFTAAALVPRMQKYFSFLETSLAGKEHLVGDSFTGADAMVILPVEYIEAFAGLQEYPNIAAWLERMRKRPAFLRAEEKGDKVDPRVFVGCLQKGE
ncbi:glutathione S-transferase, partial [Phenoliferia sp. Uapishka_3]